MVWLKVIGIRYKADDTLLMKTLRHCYTDAITRYADMCEGIDTRRRDYAIWRCRHEILPLRLMISHYYGCYIAAAAIKILLIVTLLFTLRRWFHTPPQNAIEFIVMALLRYTHYRYCRRLYAMIYTPR